MLGALAWLGALLAGVTATGDGPMGPVLTIGGFAVFAAVAVGVTILPRRRRWRGDVRPRGNVRPPYQTRYPPKPPKPLNVEAEERWGVTEQLADRAWVREAGRLSWRQATVYLVGGNTGLVVDPWFLARRAYIFDDTCHVGPSPTPEGLNPGFNLRRKNGVLRVSQGTQVIDLAVPKSSLPALALIGASGPADEVAEATEATEPAVAVSEQRLARIARADRRAARRHAFFARINARSKTNPWVAAACSLFYLVLAAGSFMGLTRLGQTGAAFMLVVLWLLGAAGAYAVRVVFPHEHG